MGCISLPEKNNLTFAGRFLYISIIFICHPACSFHKLLREEAGSVGCELSSLHVHDHLPFLKVQEIRYVWARDQPDSSFSSKTSSIHSFWFCQKMPRDFSSN